MKTLIQAGEMRLQSSRIMNLIQKLLISETKEINYLNILPQTKFTSINKQDIILLNDLTLKRMKIIMEDIRNDHKSRLSFFQILGEEIKLSPIYDEDDELILMDNLYKIIQHSLNNLLPLEISLLD
jgi:hypothetical protein